MKMLRMESVARRISDHFGAISSEWHVRKDSSDGKVLVWQRWLLL